MDYEIDFMPVGDSHGDAICIRYLDPVYGYVVNVIDGGYSDTGDEIVRHLRRYWDTDIINNLILTHADNDHAVGLIKVMEACHVGTLRMNMPWLYVDQLLHNYHGNFTPEGFVRRFRQDHEYLVDLERLADRDGTDVAPIFQGDTFGCFTVLAPSWPRYISLIPGLDKGPDAVNAPDSYAPRRGQNALAIGYENWAYESLQENPTPPTSESNETSVVQLARFGDYYAVFTGDVGPQGLTEAAAYAKAAGIYRLPKLFQIPHQGSRHSVTPTALDAWLGGFVPEGSANIGWAICSVGGNKLSHPRKTVTNALLRRGYATQVARNQVICYTNRMRQGWTTIPPEPFHTSIEEAA